MSANVVGLVRESSGDVGVGAGRNQKDAKEPNLCAGVESHDGQADQAQDAVEDDDGPAKPVLVACPAGKVGNDAGKNVRGSDEALSLTDAETQVAAEDGGEEVGECVGDGGGVEEDHGVQPDLEVGTRTHVLDQRKGLDLDVAAISVNAGADPFLLLGAQEAPALSLGVGEVDQKPVSADTEDDGNDTLNDEDPSPTVESGRAGHLHDSVGKDTGKGAGHGADKVKD